MDQETFNKIQTVYLSHKKGQVLELKSNFQKLKNPKKKAVLKLLSSHAHHIKRYQDAIVKVVDLAVEDKPIPEYSDLCSSKLKAESFLRKNILLNAEKRKRLRMLLKRQKDFERLCYQERRSRHFELRKEIANDEKQIYYQLRKLDIEIHKRQSKFAKEIEAELSKLQVPFFFGQRESSEEQLASGKNYILDIIVDHIEGEGISSSTTSQTATHAETQ